MKLFALVGKLVLAAAALVMIAGLSLFVVGAYLATWPMHRLSPRDRRVHTIMDLGVALFAVARAYAPDKQSAPESAVDSVESVDPNQKDTFDA